MASVAALAKRRGLAYERLNGASSKLQELYSSVLPRIESKSKDPDMRRVEEVEQIADLLEAIIALTEVPKPQPAKTGKKKENSHDEENSRR